MNLSDADIFAELLRFSIFGAGLSASPKARYVYYCTVHAIMLDSHRTFSSYCHLCIALRWLYLAGMGYCYLAWLSQLSIGKEKKRSEHRKPKMAEFMESI